MRSYKDNLTLKPSNINDTYVRMLYEEGPLCAMVTHSPPTSEVGSSNHGPHVAMLIVPY